MAVVGGVGSGALRLGAGWHAFRGVRIEVCRSKVCRSKVSGRGQSGNSRKECDVFGQSKGICSQTPTGAGASEAMEKNPNKFGALFNYTID
jgi:hypothetical protein